MIAAVLFISFAVLLLIGAPIAVCLGVSSVISMIIQGAGRPLETVMSSLPQLFSSSTSKFVLLAIPFFILAGNIMDKAQISKRLIRLAETCVGHLRGGMAIVCVIVACFFAAISGSGPATVAALGLVMIPGMIRSGYSPSFSAALMGCAGAIGVIIPPSITFVVYGSIADTSIGDLFKAGVVPGLIMGAALIIAALIIGRKLQLESLPKASWHDRWVAFKDAFWGLLMPVIILGGIYGGIFTPTEAAAVAVAYGLIVGLFVYRDLKAKDLYRIFGSAALTTATIMVILGTATTFGRILTLERIPTMIADFFESVAKGPIMLLILINILLLIVGCFMETNAAIIILAPIFLPIVESMGINPVHFGIVMVVNLAIGFVTPPLGVNLFVSCNVANAKLEEICKGILPILGVMILDLLLITYIEPLSMFLPALLGY